MIDRANIERAAGHFQPDDGSFERLERRRDRRRRNQRLAAGALGVAIMIAGVLVAASLLRSGSVPGGGTADPTPAPLLPTLRRDAEVLQHACCDGGIQAVDPTTGASRLLVEKGVTDAAWSPDGTRLAYELPCIPTDEHTPLCDTPESRQSGVWILDAGGEPRQLVSYFGAGMFYEGTSGYPDAGFAWSPDGSRIAFTQPSNEPGLYVADADGSSPTLLPGTEGARALDGWSGEARPAWAPDGSRIAFADRRGVFMVWLDGGGRTLVSDRGGDPAWSPDGSHLAFSTSDGIVVVDADGSGPVGVGNGYEFAWSPDGDRIVYHIEKSVKGGFLEELWVVSADGSDPTPILRSDCCSGIVDGSLTWSPDGTRVAFLASERDGDEPWRTIDASGGSASHAIEELPEIDVLEVLGWLPCLCTLGGLA